MFAWINGQFVPEKEAVVSIFDRGFLYGDGLFETLRIRNGCPVQWRAHWTRLSQGASALGISMPWNLVQVRSVIEELVARNEMPDAVLRIALTRGRGLRGYSPKGAGEPTMVLALYPALAGIAAHPDGIALAVSSYRVMAGDPLLQIKSGSQLIRVMARAEAESRGVDEALLLNHHGRVAEAASANLFWLREHTLCTPPVSEGALPGITRATLIELCNCLTIPYKEIETRLEDLAYSNGVFLTNSSWGIVEATALDGRPLPRSEGCVKIVQACRQSLQETTIQ